MLPQFISECFNLWFKGTLLSTLFSGNKPTNEGGDGVEEVDWHQRGSLGGYMPLGCGAADVLEQLEDCPMGTSSQAPFHGLSMCRVNPDSARHLSRNTCHIIHTYSNMYPSLGTVYCNTQHHPR